MHLPPGLSLTVEDEPAAADVELLPRELEAFNESRWPGHQPWRPLGIFVRDRGRTVAGLVGQTYASWRHVRYLWVAECLRGRGVGRRLMAEAEARALSRGCHSAELDTFSFQARGFYEKLGYEVFGTLDHPPHERFFLEKRLAKEPISGAGPPG